MDIIYQSMNMARDSFLSTCKVCCFLKLEARAFNYFAFFQLQTLCTGEAESGLERLHQCAEKELQTYLNSESQLAKEFNEFRTKLAGLTRLLLIYNFYPVSLDGVSWRSYNFRVVQLFLFCLTRVGCSLWCQNPCLMCLTSCHNSLCIMYQVITVTSP